MTLADQHHVQALNNTGPLDTCLISAVAVMHCSVTTKPAGDTARRATQGSALSSRSLIHASFRTSESLSEYSQSAAKRGTGEIYV